MPLPFSLQLLEGWFEPDHYFQRFGRPDSELLLDALICSGSLTRHLEGRSGQVVKIRLKKQTLIPDWLENPTLWGVRHRLPPDDRILSRNAWLELAGQDWVFAHSQVAVSGLVREARQEIELGAEPLGSLFLQREGLVEREALELAQALIPELACHIGMDEGMSFWCRRSLFRVNGIVRARILELFLPPLMV